MDANRYEEIGGTIIEEFYWTGRMVVYIDNKLSPLTFEEACRDVKENLE